MGEVAESTGKSSRTFFFLFLFLILCTETDSQSERLLSLMASTSALVYQGHYTLTPFGLILNRCVPVGWPGGGTARP